MEVNLLDFKIQEEIFGTFQLSECHSDLVISRLAFFTRHKGRKYGNYPGLATQQFPIFFLIIIKKLKRNGKKTSVRHVNAIVQAM